jgi:hypothetical protein
MTAAAGWFWRQLKRWASQLAWRSGSAAGGLSVIARLDLGAKKSLLVVAYGERRFLLANGAETLSAPVDIGAGRAAARPGGGMSGAPRTPKSRRAAGPRLRVRAAGSGSGERARRVGR